MTNTVIIHPNGTVVVRNEFGDMPVTTPEGKPFVMKLGTPFIVRNDYTAVEGMFTTSNENSTADTNEDLA